MKNYLEIYLYYKKTAIDEVERKQDKFNGILGVLENYTPRNNMYAEAKNKLLNNAKKIYEGREKITEGFKNGVLPFYYDETYENRMKFEREQEEREEEGIKNIRNKNDLID